MIARMPEDGIISAILSIIALAAFSEPGEEATPSSLSPDMEALKAEARTATREFGPTLKAELRKSISTNGPVAAIEMCNFRAPNIAAATGERHGLQIGRASHRVRNRANAPDVREATRLQELLAAAERGADLGTLDFGAVIETDDGPVLRYMRDTHQMATGGILILINDFIGIIRQPLQIKNIEYD